MENQKNFGVLIAPPRPKDYILGGTASINISRAVRDWTIYLPANECQRSKVDDFLDCVTMSALHSIETQLNYLLSTNQLSDEALYFFHNNNYIINGSFEFSPRFNAKLNGTDLTKGQYLNVAGDCIRRDGLLPASDWPVSDDMSWDEFYRMIPIGLFSKAKKALWFVDIKYQWVGKADFPLALPFAPLQVATHTCPGWDVDKVVPACSSNNLNHATVVYGKDEQGNWKNLDQYPPFKQILASNYEFPVNMEYLVTVKPLTLRNGMRGSNVLQLQRDLNKLGFNLKEDSDFGNMTEIGVRNFQHRNLLSVDGIAGPATLAKVRELLPSPSSKIDLWCEAIKKMEGAKPERNNPGNLRFVGQQYAVNDNGFCRFDTYQHGYDALRTLLINACTGKSSNYRPDETLYEFYAGIPHSTDHPNRYGRIIFGFSPASDGNDPKHYSEVVANYIGVDPLTIIKTLI